MKPSWSARTAQLLEVLQWPGVGPARARELARNLPPTEEPLRAAEPLLRRTVAGDARAAAAAAAARILEDCERLGLHVISMLDDAYPARLRAIDESPPLLFVRGTTAALAGPSVAVVGTREASDAGRQAAFRVAEHLAKKHITVVSGLALGIDASGHEGALAGGGVTVAILAHGLHTVAPVTNRPIAERLLESGGALVSEHAPGVPPRPAEFARRNRIQSGMSVASIIVESGEEGGAMIQAAFTRQQHRLILAVVSSRPGFNDAGARRLLREFGAQSLEDPRQLDEKLAPVLGRPPLPVGQKELAL